MDRTAIDCARRTVLARDPAQFSPAAVVFLLREYVTSGDPDVRCAAEQGLTRGLASLDDPDPLQRLEWLHVLADASAVSDDQRLREEVHRALPAAITQLEGLVRGSYEPGEGLLDQTCHAQLRCASALLAAFDLSGRLPYAMLAEELLRHARRISWRDEAGQFDAVFAANCTALRVLCRLAGMHADPAYRAAAVLAPGSTYSKDARRLAASLIARSADFQTDADEFGQAVLEWFALDPNLQ